MLFCFEFAANIVIMLQIQMIVEKIFLKNAETIDFCKLITPLATTHVWPIKRRMGQARCLMRVPPHSFCVIVSYFIIYTGSGNF